MTIGKFDPLDPVIHSQVRLAVLSVLATVREADFQHLKELTGTSDGNLSTHLGKLEEAGYIAIHKAFKGKKPRTSCRITERGRNAFSGYLRAIESYLPESPVRSRSGS
jgi:DNA-binding transcriptional ArsR family regulator